MFYFTIFNTIYPKNLAQKEIYSRIIMAIIIMVVTIWRYLEKTAIYLPATNLKTTIAFITSWCKSAQLDNDRYF